MYVKIKSPHSLLVRSVGRVAPGQIINLTGAEALPLIAAGNAVPRSDVDDYLEQLKEKARRLGQSVDWDKQPPRPRPGARVMAMASAPSHYPPENTEPFATKLTRAISNRLSGARLKTVKEAKEQAERERARYRGPVRRPRSRGE